MDLDLDLAVLLRSLGLEKYEQAFLKNEIEETVLASLTRETSEEAWSCGGQAPAQAVGRHCDAARAKCSFSLTDAVLPLTAP